MGRRILGVILQPFTTLTRATEAASTVYAYYIPIRSTVSRVLIELLVGCGGEDDVLLCMPRIQMHHVRINEESPLQLPTHHIPQEDKPEKRRGKERTKRK